MYYDLFLSFFADQAHNVTIHNKDVSLRGGTQHEFTCEALGSRPAAVITWWLDDLQIQPQVDNIQIVRTKQGFLQLYERINRVVRIRKTRKTFPSEI